MPGEARRWAGRLTHDTEQAGEGEQAEFTHRRVFSGAEDRNAHMDRHIARKRGKRGAVADRGIETAAWRGVGFAAIEEGIQGGTAAGQQGRQRREGLAARGERAHHLGAVAGTKLRRHRHRDGMRALRAERAEVEYPAAPQRRRHVSTHPVPDF